MTPDELTAYGKSRYPGRYWINPLSKETGFACSTIWRAARGTKPVSREIEQAILLLPKRPKRHLSTKQGSNP